MPPTVTNGKICDIELPATDIQRSAVFYHEDFGWRLRQRGDGHTAFDDAVGQVSATWIQGRPPADAPELTARFRDPGGNVLGVYQERVASARH
jgi:uncharacterized protein